MSRPTNYNSHGTSLGLCSTRDSHSGQSYSDQARTTLPPPTISFPTSDPPGSSLNFTLITYPNLTFPYPDTVYNDYLYPYPSQRRPTTPASSQQHYCTCPWRLINAASMSSNSDVKISLPSSNCGLHTIILRTPRLLNSQDTMIVRHMTLITELHHPLVQPTLGGTRPRPRIPGKNSARLMLTRILDTGRITRPLRM
jgi:hypothetical protein